MVYRPWSCNAAVAAPVRSTALVRVLSRSSALPEKYWLPPSNGAPTSVVFSRSGSTTTAPWALALLYSCGPSSMIFCWPATTVA